MKLGGGYVKLRQKLPLKASEGEAELDLFEHCGVDIVAFRELEMRKKIMKQ